MEVRVQITSQNVHMSGKRNFFYKEASSLALFSVKNAQQQQNVVSERKYANIKSAITNLVSVEFEHELPTEA